MVGLEHDARLRGPARPEQGQLWGPAAACPGLGVEETEPGEAQRVQAERRGAEAGLMKAFFPTRRARQWRRHPGARCSHPWRFLGSVWIK